MTTVKGSRNPHSGISIPDDDFIWVTLPNGPPYNNIHPDILSLDIVYSNASNLSIMFPNLKHLIIGRLCVIPTFPTTLQTLKIRDFESKSPNFNIQDLINLEVLQIQYMSSYNKDFPINLDDFPRLTELDIPKEIKLSYSNHYPNIRSIKYRNKQFRVTKETFPNLEELECHTISNSSDIEDITTLKYIESTFVPEDLDLTKFENLEHYSGDRLSLPIKRLPNLTYLRLYHPYENASEGIYPNFYLNITSELFPKLETCTIVKYNVSVTIDHDNLELLTIGCPEILSVRAPNLRRMRFYTFRIRNVGFAGPFDKLYDIDMCGEGDEGSFIDFDKFPALKEFSSYERDLEFVGVCKNLEMIRFKNGTGVLDFSEFDGLRILKVAGILNHNVVLGKNVEEVVIHDGRNVDLPGTCRRRRKSRMGWRNENNSEHKGKDIYDDSDDSSECLGDDDMVYAIKHLNKDLCKDCKITVRERLPYFDEL